MASVKIILKHIFFARNNLMIDIIVQLFLKSLKFSLSYRIRVQIEVSLLGTKKYPKNF
jgi:hypothetical protein